jgi:aminopeptidase-like protein
VIDMNVVNRPDTILALTRDLCGYATGVVADDNEALFRRIGQELPLTLHRYRSGETFNGWVVPDNWRAKRAEIRRDGNIVFDGRVNVLGVARYAKSFRGSLDWEELKPRLITNPDLPTAHVFHCVWQYRPWAAEWAFSVPYELYKTLGPGRYEVELETEYLPGDMIVAQHDKCGRSDNIIVFQSHSCHPHMANDGFAGAALLIRLMQELQGRDTHYTYRLVIGPEHIGTVFYLRDMPKAERDRILCGVFEEMPGTGGPVKIAATFLGRQMVDRAFAHAARHHSAAHVSVPWRQGAGNDETVWEAPGYEVPFLEVTRSEDLMRPFREYHTDLDNPDLMDPRQLDEMLRVLRKAVDIFENNCRIWRKFDGLICLSNPIYDLYMERADPAIAKDLPADSEKWGYLLDCLLRYLDGSMTILDIAEKHDLPFDRVLRYIKRFEEKGLVRLEFVPMTRQLPKLGPA